MHNQAIIPRKSLFFLLMTMWVSHFCVDFMIGIWAIFKSMAEIDLAKAGFITALCVTAGEGCQFIFGAISDRGYQKHLMMIGILISCAALLFPFATTTSLCILLCLSVSIGSAAFHPPAAGMLGGLSKKRRGMLLTFFWSGGALGMAMSQLSFTKAIDFFGGHALPLIFFPLILLTFLFPFTLPVIVNPSKEKKKISDLFRFFRRRELKLLYFTQVSTQIVYWSTIFILPDILLARGAEKWVSFGGGHLCFMMGSVIMMIPIGYLADKFSARLISIYSVSLSLFFLYIFLLSSTAETSFLLPLLFILGACMGVLNPLGLAIGNQYVPDKPGMISAFLMGLVWCVTESLGPGGIGLLTKFFSQNQAAKALMLMGLCFFISLTTLLKLPKPSQEEEMLILAEPVSS